MLTFGTLCWKEDKSNAEQKPDVDPSKASATQRGFCRQVTVPWHHMVSKKRNRSRVHELIWISKGLTWHTFYAMFVAALSRQSQDKEEKPAEPRLSWCGIELLQRILSYTFLLPFNYWAKVEAGWSWSSVSWEGECSTLQLYDRSIHEF